MDSAEKLEAGTASTETVVEAAGGNNLESKYFEGEGTLAAPSLPNTSSRYLNSPYFKEVYAYSGLRRNGPDVSMTYIIPMVSRALAETVDFADYMQKLEIEKSKNPVFADFLAARRETAYVADDLVGSTPGTLAHMIWEFLTSTGYDLEFMMKGVTPTNDIDYLNKRRANTHDITHLITGFGANFAGECALNWYEISSTAKFLSPELAHYVNFGQSMLVTGSLHQVCTHYPAVHPVMMEATKLGIAMGQAIEMPIFMQPWEDWLDWRIEDIATHLGIVRGPGQAAWDWTKDATWG